MLSQGVFGGAFFCRRSYQIGIPDSLFQLDQPNQSTGNYRYYISNLQPLAYINVTGVLVDQRHRDMDIPNPIRIYHPAGWFQWYCAFWYGVRCMADKYRIAQWVNEVNTLYGLYKAACTTYAYPIGVWTQEAPPNDTIKGCIQTLFEIGWDFRNQTLPS